MCNKIHLIYKSIIKCTLITVIIYLSFKYLLPLIFPFLTACLLVKAATPLTNILHEKFHIPEKIANFSSIIILTALIIGSFTLVIIKMYGQFRLFCSNYHEYYNFCCSTLSGFLDNISSHFDSIFKLHQGTSVNFVLERLDSLENTYIDKICANAGSYLTKCFTYIARYVVLLFIIFISMIIYSKDRSTIQKQYRSSILYKPVHTILSTLKSTGAAYIKAQLIIIASNWVVCSMAFLLIHSPYFILLGFIISVVDALPVLGSGIFLVPTGIYYIITGNYFYAAIMFTAYVITIFVREILEARLLGASMDILPFYILASVYIGLNIFGVSGIILGPFGLILIKTIYKMV